MATFHPGERAVQTRAGVTDMASRMGRSLYTSIPPIAADFLRRQRMAVAGTVDAESWVWASLLTGQPGFIEALDERTIRINARPIPDDPFNDNLRQTKDLGLLVIDLATRQRMRVNGTAVAAPGGIITLHAREVYGNCPKYVQPRGLAADREGAPLDVRHRGQRLTGEQQRWISQADTFFIASFHPQGGADASHRGGRPGFIRVLNARTLEWPDYAGNNLFQTLGNLAEDPRAGLLFLDFERGSTLQLTGEAEVVWNARQTGEPAETGRAVRFHIERTVEIAGATFLRWQLLEPLPPDRDQKIV